MLDPGLARSWGWSFDGAYPYVLVIKPTPARKAAAWWNSDSCFFLLAWLSLLCASAGSFVVLLLYDHTFLRIILVLSVAARHRNHNGEASLCLGNGSRGTSRGLESHSENLTLNAICIPGGCQETKETGPRHPTPHNFSRPLVSSSRAIPSDGMDY